MDSRRRTERNKVLAEIKATEKYILTNEATIGRLRNTTADPVFNLSQTQKLTAKNEEHDLTLKRLQKRLLDLDNGFLDEELEDQATAIKDEIDRKSSATRKKKESTKIAIPHAMTYKPQPVSKPVASTQPKPKEVALTPKIEPIRSREPPRSYSNSPRDNSRRTPSNRYSSPFVTPKTPADSSLEYFQKACDTVPDYMMKKLKVMPNNKGYIWRDVYCFGELPAEKGQPTLIFDKQRDGTMIIHEWTLGECKVWRKPENGPKVLQSSRARGYKI